MALSPTLPSLLDLTPSLLDLTLTLLILFTLSFLPAWYWSRKERADGQGEEARECEREVEGGGERWVRGWGEAGQAETRRLVELARVGARERAGEAGRLYVEAWAWAEPGALPALLALHPPVRRLHARLRSSLRLACLLATQFALPLLVRRKLTHYLLRAYCPSVPCRMVLGALHHYDLAWLHRANLDLAATLPAVRLRPCLADPRQASLDAADRRRLRFDIPVLRHVTVNAQATESWQTGALIGSPNHWDEYFRWRYLHELDELSEDQRLWRQRRRIGQYGAQENLSNRTRKELAETSQTHQINSWLLRQLRHRFVVGQLPFPFLQSESD